MLTSFPTSRSCLLRTNKTSTIFLNIVHVTVGSRQTIVFVSPLTLCFNFIMRHVTDSSSLLNSLLTLSFVQIDYIFTHHAHLFLLDSLIPIVRRLGPLVELTGLDRTGLGLPASGRRPGSAGIVRLRGGRHDGATATQREGGKQWVGLGLGLGLRDRIRWFSRSLAVIFVYVDELICFSQEEDYPPNEDRKKKVNTSKYQQVLSQNVFRIFFKFSLQFQVMSASKNIQDEKSGPAIARPKLGPRRPSGVDGTPSSFRSFGCSSPTPKINTTVKEKDADRKADSESRQDDREKSGPGASQCPAPDPPVAEVVTNEIDMDGTGPSSNQSTNAAKEGFAEETSPTKDLTTPEKSMNTSSMVTSPRSEHVCLNKLITPNKRSETRHDNTRGSPTSEEASPFTLDPGTVLDPDNEGDAVIMSRYASKSSDLTDDLIHLKPGLTSDTDSPNPPQACLPTSKQVDIVDVSEKKKEQVNDASEATADIADEKAKVPVLDDHERMENASREMDRQHAAFDHCRDHCRRPQNGPADSDSLDSYGSPNSYQGGMAGLDPDHSAEWVPSYIDMNESKSKKRRRRQKKKQELLKQHDSLGKLMRGEQSKEDAERISTLDLGNQRYEKKKARLQTESEILSGNLLQKTQGQVHDCQERGQINFSSTFNSTQYGQDFDDMESLRDESGGDEPLVDEDLEVDGDRKGDETAKEDNADDSLSSNSTGTKRKRKRNNKKKNPTNKQAKSTQQGAAGPELGRETRSKTMHRVHEAHEDRDDPKDKDSKGEKEKHPASGAEVKETMEADPKVDVGNVMPGSLVPYGPDEEAPTTSGANKGGGQVVVFKQPRAMSRHDIQRIVTKAVQKSRNRVSNNFAFNSKIQRFKVVTDSADIKKFPEINQTGIPQEIAIPEFIWPDEDKTLAGKVTVKSRGVVQFIILARSEHAAPDAWDTPKIDLVRDFASFLLCTIADLKLEFGTILRWTNPWGNVVVMGLDTADLDLLQKFRTFFTTLRFAQHYFNTFPKDAMTSSLGISVMLKNDLREFKEEFLTEALFARNNLFGVLETVEAETYTASDTTRAGVSKNGWRSVLLEGDETFLASLAQFPALHWFNLGPASVQIHGGERRAETAEEIEAKNRRRRMNMPMGQTLTNAARNEISQAFLRDQKKLLQDKKNAKTTAQAPAHSHTQPHDGAKTGTAKKKK